jgi:SAM-dependent methyltransferase
MENHPHLLAWLEAVSASFNASELIKITLKNPGPAAGDLKSIDVRPVIIKRETKLSFTYHYKTRDIVKNHGLAEAKDMFAGLMDDTFLAARLFSKAADTGLSRQGNVYALNTSKPSMQLADLTHNKPKNHLISAGGKQYLHALGLTDKAGDVLKTAQDKFRQINKYIEIIDGLVRDLPTRKLRIVDMGAGKGYLTFALYDHLTNTLKRDCQVVGVEFRPDLVKLCNEIANASGFSGLSFVEGSIANYDCDGADIVIALHACDTATDDAIAKAIKADAKIIVVAPCCHKQIRREMRAAKVQNDLDFLLRYGTYQERMAEMITDGLRANLMELHGYDCNLFEFISDAHTPKNVMIVGKKMEAQRRQDVTAKIAANISMAKQQFGISTHYLEQLLAV